jgi:hypothetical protein
MTLVALATGCGGSNEDAASATTVRVTVTVSDWTAGDCDAAGKHDGRIYRVCHSFAGERGLQVLAEGRVEEIAVKDPPGATGGSWYWAALSPDGRTFLATWSGECEIPIAFTFPVDGGTPRAVTGEQDWTKAPESQALGWTTDGKPIVGLLRGACGIGADEPGIYVFDAGGPRRVEDGLEESLEPRDV